MKKTFAAAFLTGALLSTAAQAEIKTLGCAFTNAAHPTTTFKLSFDTETQEAVLRGSLTVGTLGYSYDLVPSRVAGSDYLLTINKPLHGAFQSISTLTIESKFSLPADKTMVTIAVAGEAEKLICPIPTRAHGLD